MATVLRDREQLTTATQDLRAEVLRDGAPFRGRLVLVAEAFRQSEGEVYRGMRTAKATRHIFEKMPVQIRRGEILVGWHPNSHPDEATRKAIDEATAYLRTQTYWVTASEGHMAPDYEALLRDGIGGTLRRVAEPRAGLDPLDPATAEKQAFYDAARLSLEAFQHLILRYADLAEEMAQATDEDWWAKELRTAAAVCRHVASEPARTFREAIQLTWLLYLAVCLEASESHHCFGPGRPDQYLYPFYVRDREAGTLDDATLEALLDQFFIKCNEFEGRSMSAVILVLGGRKPDGSDATNELSWKLLEACGRVRMYFPGCDILWHPGIDAEFLRAAVALLRNGNGQPSFFNDEAIVRGLVRRGIPFDHAVDHLPSTCTETSLAGRTNPWVAHPYCNIAKVLLNALFGGTEGTGSFPAPGKGACPPVQEGIGGQAPRSKPNGEPVPGLPTTFAELREAFFRQLDHEARAAIAMVLDHQWQASQYRLFPLLSCFIQDCLARGKDIAQGGCLYTFLQPEAVGISNVVDGLAAIKVLVEGEGEASVAASGSLAEGGRQAGRLSPRGGSAGASPSQGRKRFTLDDFRAAIRANFEGHGELLKAIHRDCPKHGNDVAWVNQLFAEVASGWCSALEGHTSRYGGPVLPGFLGWTVWIQFGEQTPATPDGRLAGAPLANSLANCTGVRVKGFPSLVLSATGFDHSRGLGGITFNVRFGANSLAAEGGVERLKGLIEAAFDLGLYQVQIDLSSPDVLRDAQAHPERHDDLFVRIGGYLVPFTLLPRNAQEDVIARTELEL